MTPAPHGAYDDLQKGIPMAPTDQGLRIVYRYTNHAAPTGESEREVTEDGRHWRVSYGGTRGTGDVCAVKRGDRLVELP
jgi:hypothetical protein